MIYLILVLNLLLASNLFAQGQNLSGCSDESCLRSVIPYDAKSPPSLDSCKVLDGKKSKADFDEDLGALCRLRVSRAMASQRSTEPCTLKPGDINPDWKMDLSQKVLQKFYNEDLMRPVLQKFGVTELSDTGGVNNSTIHGSFVYDDQRQEVGGQKRSISFAAYYCIAQNPEHYSPYFWTFKINDKIVDQGYVANPPKVEKVLLQDNPYTGFMDASQLSDVDGDGNKDNVMLEKDIFKGYRPLVCLYQPNKTECFAVSTEDFVKIDEMFIKAKVVSIGNKQIKIEFSKDGKKIGNVTYQLDGKKLKLVQKQLSSSGQ